MVQTQSVWVSDLSSATGRATYGLSCPPLLVLLPASLVSSSRLGDVVHIIGHASTALSPAGGSSACGVQVRKAILQGAETSRAGR